MGVDEILNAFGASISGIPSKGEICDWSIWWGKIMMHEGVRDKEGDVRNKEEDVRDREKDVRNKEKEDTFTR